MAVEFDDNDLSTYSDAQLVEFIDTLPCQPQHAHITLLSPRFVSKAYWDPRAEDAIAALDCAFRLGIRVPRIRRIVHDQDVVYCIMDRVHGFPLDTQWPSLGWLTSIRLALQMRGIVYRMQSLHSTTAGSLATGRCRSFYLEDSFGLPPKASTAQIDAFVNFWANFTSIRHEIKKTATEHSVCPETKVLTAPPLVFVHHDLAPRNILLDRNGRLWLVDWDYAGFYPKSFEYAGMHNFLTSAWGKFAIWRWKLFTLIAGGLYGSEARWLEIARSKFTRFRFARRFNMKFKGYASAAGRSDSGDLSVPFNC